MRGGGIGGPRSSHGDTDSVNDTSAFCDKPEKYLRGPAPQVSTRSFLLKPVGMFVTSFHDSPAPRTVPRDGRDLPAPPGRRLDHVSSVLCSDCWGGRPRDRLRSCLCWSDDRTRCTLDAWGHRRQGKAGFRLPLQGPVAQQREDSAAPRALPEGKERRRACDPPH